MSVNSEEVSALMRPSEYKDEDEALTMTQYRLIHAALCLNVAAVYLGTGILASFFPKEAILRGLSQSEVGFIFAIFPTFWLFSAPLFASLAPVVGPRWLMIGGLFGVSICLASFGFVSGTSRWSFLGISLMVRAIQGVCSAACITSGYIIVASSFRSSMGQAMGVMEIFVGVGYALGAPVGGFLFELGGFGLPFWAVGGFVFVVAILLHFFLPLVYKRRQSGVAQKSFFALLSDGRILLDCLIGLFALSVLALLEPSAQLHITKFYAWVTPGTMGLFFMLCILCYSITAPLAGFSSDSIGRQPVIIVGLVVIAVGLYMFGPVGWPFPMDLSVIVAGLAVVGLGMGASVVPVVPDMIECAGSGNEETAAGLTGTFSLGEILGPLVGSLIIEYYGINLALSIWAGMALTLALTLFLVKITGLLTWPNANHKDPYLL